MTTKPGAWNQAADYVLKDLTAAVVKLGDSLDAINPYDVHLPLSYDERSVLLNLLHLARPAIPPNHSEILATLDALVLRVSRLE